MAEQLRGFSAAPGRSCGPSHLVRSRHTKVARKLLPKSQREQEVERLEEAAQALSQELTRSMSTLGGQPDSETRALAEALINSQQAVLSDPLFIGGMKRAVTERGLCAEWAVEQTLEELQRRFRALTDERFKAWFNDVRGIAEELLSALDGAAPRRYLLCDPGDVVVACSLTISDTIALLERGAAGFVLERGSMTSHVAVLCRSAGVPVVTGLNTATELLSEEQLLVVDGGRGEVHLVAERPRWAQVTESFEETLPPAVAPDGTPVTLRANLEVKLDARWAQAQGTEGVGLWRTFFQYLGRLDLPSEDELTARFTKVAQDFAPAPVHVRLLDLSGPFDEEELPLALRGLGPCRGIRLRHRRPEVLETQIRALVRASKHGQLRLLVPFVTDADELVWVKERVAGAIAELNPNAQLPVGAMIEVPAALLCLEDICTHAEHLAIGTNDLNALLLGYGREDPRQPGPPPRVLLNAIEAVVSAAAERGLTVSLCGEMAADPRATRALMETGLRQLSLTPRRAPAVRLMLHDLHRRSQRALQQEPT